MSKTKRLLSVTLAIAMIILSAFSAFAEDTETVVEPLRGTVTAEDVTVKPGVTEVTVPVTITFENNQTSPHGMFDISADGATLESATLVSFNNDNYVKDPNLPDEENIDKSVYLDTANGRVVVESDVSEGKQPSVSYVTVDVVLEFPTALAAGQVIDVVISNIAATNLSEAPWTGMSAVNGKITVTAAEPECDHADVTFVSATPATETDPGEISFTCDGCGNTVVEEVTYQKTSSLATPAIECGATTQLIFRITTKNYSTAEAAILTVEHTMFTGEKDFETYTHENFQYDATLSSNKWTLPVISTNFNDVFVATLYVCRDGVWYSGITRNTSVTEAAMSSITGTSATEEVKVTAANLLKMGSEIQKHFNVNVENLPDAGLVGDYANYVTTTVPSVKYDETNYNLADTSVAKTEKKVALSKPSITLSDAMIINMNAVVSYYTDSDGNIKPINDFKAVYSYTAANGASVNDVAEYVIDSRGRYVLSIPVAAPNMSSAITVQIFDGETPISDATVCSVESILAVNVESDSTLAQLAYAAINYSIASRKL